MGNDPDELLTVLENAIKDFDNQEYSSSVELLQKYADQGFKDAQSRLGIAYHLGLGVSRNIQKAKFFLENAANQNSGTAAHNLGTLYLEPEMLDSKKSKYWYRKAKTLGFVVASDEWYE